ncbi:hypothetical protein MHF_0160 [Mycoplasma haemofelis Ohio2]|uniref:Uncharacterized protein n=1 Tax=Mycoplasma haemofelis (strain Ohio2) TaxID=859194 RepID=F6FFZ5_MYCHI|nr:hypothetical protein MHF_0160 [Mycoplasma haemofelis Ohio2]
MEFQHKNEYATLREHEHLKQLCKESFQQQQTILSLKSQESKRVSTSEVVDKCSSLGVLIGTKLTEYGWESYYCWNLKGINPS